MWRIGLLRHQPVMFTSWRIVHSFLIRNSTFFKSSDYFWFLGAVTSHSNIGGGLDPLNPIPNRMPEEAFRLAINVLKRFKVVTANSMILHDLLKPVLPHVLYCPNGVDVDFFIPATNCGKFNPNRIRIGWVGKERGPKNFMVVKKALAQLEAGGGFETPIVHIEKGFRNIPLTREGMRDYYGGIDFYLCASWNEGTPNPALEAGACGVPVVSTRVGNMPELINEGENGYFIEPTVDSIVQCFNGLRGIASDRYSVMSQGMRSVIERDWSWPKRIGNFVAAFDDLCKTPQLTQAKTKTTKC
jgi:glycosyltransferase involved in cell wall biosynthesis